MRNKALEGTGVRRTVAVRVKPGNSRPGVAPDGDRLLVRTCARPTRGKANAEALRLLSAYLGVPKSRLSILRGSRARDKIIAIADTAS